MSVTPAAVTSQPSRGAKQSPTTPRRGERGTAAPNTQHGRSESIFVYMPSIEEANRPAWWRNVAEPSCVHATAWPRWVRSCAQAAQQSAAGRRVEKNTAIKHLSILPLNRTTHRTPPPQGWLLWCSCPGRSSGIPGASARTASSRRSGGPWWAEKESDSRSDNRPGSPKNTAK